MADVVTLYPGVPAVMLKWETIEVPYILRGIEVQIIASFEPPQDEYLVVLMDTYASWDVVAHIPRHAENALALARQRAEDIHDVMVACESTWVDRGLMTEDRSGS